MATAEKLAAVIDQLCEGFETNNTDVVELFTLDGSFTAITGNRHDGHRAMRTLFARMFEAAPNAHYELTDRIIEPPNRAVIVWTKSSFADGRSSWWLGLDVLEIDSDGLITSKSVYSKAISPLVHSGEASS